MGPTRLPTNSQIKGNKCQCLTVPLKDNEFLFIGSFGYPLMFLHIYMFFGVPLKIYNLPFFFFFNNKYMYMYMCSTLQTTCKV